MLLHTSSAYLTAAQNTRSLVPFQAIEHLTLHNSADVSACGLTSLPTELYYRPVA